MPAPLSYPGSRYLASPLRTLYDVCCAAGRDQDGAACPACPVHDICAADREKEAARVARTAAGAIGTCVNPGVVAV